MSSDPAPDPPFHREPPSRLAVFLRPSKRLLGVAALTLTLALMIGAWPSPQEAQAGEKTPGRTQPKPAQPATTKLAGIRYTEARAYFERLGYEAAYAADTQTLTLTTTTGELVFTAEKREARLNGLRIFLGEPATLHKGAVYLATIDLERFLLPILRPALLKPRPPLRTIVIDAGHGGVDTGTQNKARKIDEKACTLDVAQRLQRLLGEDRWRVLLTRDTDRFLELSARAEFANTDKADLFVSIHFNAVANNAAVRGTETYVLTSQFQRSTSSLKAMPEDKVGHPGNRHDAWNAVLGYHMHRQLLAKLKTDDRGLKRARFAVLRLVDCPAVLVEAGYLSNDTEAQKIGEETYRGDIAEALYAGILGYEASLASAAGKRTE